MRLTLEFASRYFQFEVGRYIPEADEPDEPDEELVVHVPMGFTALAPDEGIDDDEEYEAPEADCG